MGSPPWLGIGMLLSEWHDCTAKRGVTDQSKPELWSRPYAGKFVQFFNACAIARWCSRAGSVCAVQAFNSGFLPDLL